MQTVIMLNAFEHSAEPKRKNGIPVRSGMIVVDIEPFNSGLESLLETLKQTGHFPLEISVDPR